MYGIEVVTPPASAPVSAAELRDWLRLNSSAEDSILTELLAGAVDLFESDAGRPVLATVYRQHLTRWPCGDVVLGRGGVTAIAGVYRRLADGSAEALTEWTADLSTPPARVALAAIPAALTTTAGVAVSPVGYVQYTAGWADAAAVPRLVRTAIRLLAAHWYQHREAHREGALAEVPDGWRRVVDRYRTGIVGDWGQ